MIKINNTQVYGWESAIRGMRNPKNSWNKSDSLFIPEQYVEENFEIAQICGGMLPVIKENDMKLMKTLRNAGTDHRKFLRMITVYVDLTAPLYWWKEFDTYKVGTVANSCSTMHKIHERKFILDDFSHEHLIFDGVENSKLALADIICILNHFRDRFIRTKNKEDWWQLIQLLPSSYNQKRTVMMNYEVLANMYHSRRNHKLDEWHTFCEWVESLPYSELITGDGNEG